MLVKEGLFVKPSKIENTHDSMFHCPKSLLSICDFSLPECTLGSLSIFATST